MGGRRCAIKDTLHGYVELSALETLLLDSPWLQRLRRIRQNDVTSVVYPTVQTTRFEHSLGAMHLSRLCMRAALAASPESESTRIFLRTLEADLAALPQAKSLAASAPGQVAEDLAALCGLLHDIGHPPLSHLMEQCLPYTAIDPAATSSLKWHEPTGLKIIRDSLTSVPPGAEDRALVAVAAEILDEDSPVGKALAAIGSLVSSVIDTDRMDFVMRDGRSSGSDFGHYDVQRIVQSFRILVDHEQGEARTILIRPSDKSLSAVEALLQERYKVYRWVHFHHRVMLSKAYMRYALRALQEKVVEGLEPCKFRPEGYYNLQGDPVFLDDAYAWALLEKAMATLTRLKEPTDKQARLLRVLKGLLLRERSAVPLWKSLDEFRLFDEDVLAAMHRLTVPARIAPGRCPGNLVADLVLERKDASVLDGLRERLETQPGEDWYLVEATQGLSLKAQDRILAWSQGEGRARHLSDLSRVAQSLETAWKDEIHLYVFIVSAGPEGWTQSRQDLGPRLKAGRERVARAMADFYRDDANFRKALDAMSDSR